ncbi:MAG: aldo/keto reductase [Rhodobiaceae bacterium]|nr:aldo/keto reductase [Rhodobiaceae bacterium]
MKTNDIAKTGLKVTDICFGTSGLGSMPDTYGYAVDEARAHETIRAIFDGPANFLDTSRNYGMGRSEERVGAVIRERGGLPDGFVLSTKLDRDTETDRLDGARARRSLEESLETLSLDHIPMLHLHDPEYAADVSEITRPGGAFDELFKMKEEGIVDAVGLAMGKIDLMTQLIKERPFDVLISHNRYSLLNREADALFDYAHGAGIAILNAAPFSSGVLAKGTAESRLIAYTEVDDAGLEPVRAVERVCAEYGVPMGAAALQFSIRDPRITSTIVGITKPERVAQTLEWAEFPIPEAAWEALMALPYSSEDPEANRDYKLG